VAEPTYAHDAHCNTIHEAGPEPCPPAREQQDAVVLAYVCGNEVAYSWHRSMVQLIGYDAQTSQRLGDGRGGFLALRYGTGGLIQARNQAAYDFLNDYPDADWLFWIDTDMGFPEDALEKLLEAADPVERPIVGALCFSQQEIESDGMGGRRVQPTPVIYDWITVEGQSGYAVRWDYPRDTVTQCHATGSACILIHRSVLQRMVDKFGTWYDRVPNPSTQQLFSEDLSFCVRAGALDIPVYVDTRVKTTHLKPIWVSEDFYVRERAALAILERRPDISGLKRVAMTREQAWTFDLLPDALAELGLKPTSLMHVGAHKGEEVPIYRKCGIEDITLVEPDPVNAAYLRETFPDCEVVEIAVGAMIGTATFHRAVDTVFSGLRADAGVPTTETFEVDVEPLCDIQAEHAANVLVVDTQGTELEALASADLTNVELVIVETQELSRDLYAAFWPDAVEALGKVGFVPAIRWEHEAHFADTLFVRQADGE
jgi:FkbM family methyltransferase